MLKNYIDAQGDLEGIPLGMQDTQPPAPAPPRHRAEHYGEGLQAWDLIKAQGDGPAFCRGNIIKYVTRYQRKGGLESLRKARTYLDWLIELEEAAAAQSEGK